MPFIIRHPEGMLVKLGLLRAFGLKGFLFHKKSQRIQRKKGANFVIHLVRTDKVYRLFKCSI